MRAVDTNVLVSFLTADDAEQARAARQLIDAGDIFIGTTVMLETEWVLRSGYGFPGAAIAAALRGLAGLAGVTVEEPTEIAQALDAMEEGMDFADALHVNRAIHCTEFVTFDKKLATRSAGKVAIPVQVI